MRTKILALLFMVLIALLAKAEEKCFLKTASKIYYAGNKESIPLEGFVLESDCSVEIQKKFRDIIFSMNGAIFADYVRSGLKQELGNTTVELTPAKIELFLVTEAIQTKLPEDSTWTDLKLGKNNTLLLSNEESLNFTCPNCDAPGPKTIEITVSNPITNKNRKEWLNGTLAVKTFVLVAKQHLTVNNKALTTEEFEAQKLITTTPDRYFIDQGSLIYYKLNKPLTKGTALQASDLVAINLVTAGHPVNIILNSSDLSLSASGIPMTSGKLGDSIQVKRTKGQKVIQAKVIDFNKVTIEP